MRIENEVLLDYSDVSLKPKRSTLNSRNEVDLERDFKFLYSNKTWKGVPIIASNMDTSGTLEIGRIFKAFHMLTAIHKFCAVEEWREFLTFYKRVQGLSYVENFIIPSIGLKEYATSFINLEKLFNEFEIDFKFLLVDVANGYIENFVDFIKKMRLIYPDKIIIAGNVVTAEGVEALIFAGADIIKIGIGPSAVCDTRTVAGVGVPQFSAIVECADAAHGLGGHIVADGGIKQIADFSKAFGANADFVMAGSLFTGFNQSGGDIIEKEGQEFKEVYGMSSSHAMEKYYGKKDEYKASEGNYTLVPLKGDIQPFIENVLGGIRSACSYTGAKTLKDLPKTATFVRTNRIK